MWRAFAPAVSLLCLVLGPSVALAQGQKPGVSPRVPPALAALHAAHALHLATTPRLPFRPAEPFLHVGSDTVLVDVVATGDVNALLTDLAALGLQAAAVHGRMVSGHLPIAAIPALERLGTLHFARPAYAATNAGLVTSQGDQAARADLARSLFGVDGTGVTVGVLSDSFNCLGGAATDVANNDLPTVNVVQEMPTCSGATDEGRGMLQIVHDVAPGAPLAFATAFSGQAGFANNITALRLAGADVIVDDVIYFEEPMFQDGIIAQAVDAAVAAGVPYFSSAGNSARRAYDSAFRPGPAFAMDAIPSAPGAPRFFGGIAHDFDPGGGTDVLQSFTLPSGGIMTLTLQWDSPFFSVSGAPGTQNDVDVYVLNAGLTQVVGGAVADNVNRDAVESFTFTNTTGSTANFNLMIVKFTGSNPGRFKYVLFRFGNNTTAGTINQFATNSGTLFGHANAAGAEAVGAAFFGNTPAFGVTPPVLEPFSSAGTTPILFTTAGAPALDLRAQKPEIVAPDGANTTFFGSDIGGDTDAFPNFFGTSAAAPHAAAVAALILQASPGLSPAAVYAALESTALDMGQAGFDPDTGFGLIRADAAVAAALGLPMVTIVATDPTATEAGPTTGQFTVTRTGSTAVSLTVSYTPGGTAIAGSDYVALPETVLIPAGMASAPITVTPIDDGLGEAPETVVVTLTGGAGYVVGTPGSATLTITSDASRFVAFDFDGDGRADIGVYRSSIGQWFIRRSTDTGLMQVAWGSPFELDVPVAEDFDGDRRADVAVYRRSTGVWFIRRSTDGGLTQVSWGAPSLDDEPVPGDYDGDGRTDVAVYRRSTGVWFIRRSTDGGLTQVSWGAPSLDDVPVPGDYDGDGRTDIAVYRRSTAVWFIRRSTDAGLTQVSWGAPSLDDVPVPGDYDGDGRTDIAVYRRSTGVWFIRRSTDGGLMQVGWGAPILGDVAVPADYDGDGKTDVAVYRASTGEWFIQRSTDAGLTQVSWGAPVLLDLPLPDPNR
jgi:hypothetical protein